MSYPDVLNLVRDYLATQLTPTTVVTRVPDPRPTSFVQIRHVGGQQVRPVRTAERFDVFTWSTAEETASSNAREARRLIGALGGTSTLGIMCYRVDEFLAPRQFDDPLTGLFRWWATYTITVRADDAIAH